MYKIALSLHIGDCERKINTLHPIALKPRFLPRSKVKLKMLQLVFESVKCRVLPPVNTQCISHRLTHSLFIFSIQKRCRLPVVSCSLFFVQSRSHLYIQSAYISGKRCFIKHASRIVVEHL